MKKRVVLLLAMLSAYAVTQAAPEYIDAKPLQQMIKTPVGTVKGGITVLPIITWGGDIATIYGNGSQGTTGKDSIFAKNQLNVRLQREDVFTRQLERYISGETPYLRGTLGMINAAADLLARDPRTQPVVIYQLTWSVGGDALVVKSSIANAKDLKGKTIALQAYGPHVDYLAKVLSDADLSFADVRIKWLADLTATDNSPMNAFYSNDIDAAFVIIPDALALTSGGTMGTGAEDSVKGAKILLSTKTASRIIADVYAVRADYYNNNKDQVSNLVRALMQSEEALHELVKNQSANVDAYQHVMRAAADILLDSPQAVSDVEGLYADAEYVHYAGNIEFFQNTNNPRGYTRLNEEIQNSFKAIGLITGKTLLAQAGWDYPALKSGLKQTEVSQSVRFDREAVANVVTRKQQQGGLKDGELFSFEVFFSPNQQSFNETLYRDAFNKVIDLAATYGGAIITVEGHSDPMGYLRKLKEGQPAIVLGRIKQSAKNLSIGRAQEVRDNIINYAKVKGISLDPSQFAVVGHGIAQPKNGVCGAEPCAPKNEEEWRANMRVEFRIIQVEAEADVFRPL